MEWILEDIPLTCLIKHHCPSVSALLLGYLSHKANARKFLATFEKRIVLIAQMDRGD